MVFDEVQAELEAQGYEVLPFLLPACAVNAPHRRDRVWFVAHSNHTRTDIGMRDQREWSQNDNERERQPFSEYRQDGSYGDAADPECSNLENKWHEQRSMGEENPRQSSRRFKHGIIQNNWDTFPTTEPTIRPGDDGISDRLDSITFSKWRNESIKAGGNAIVPQVVYQIFKTIEHYENLQNL
jgi:DNA (cytosine-5)-methyltransferase 1